MVKKYFVLCAVIFCLFGLNAYGEEKFKLETQYILQAKGKVVIDGKLDEWDKSGKLGPVTFDEEVAEEYNGTFYLMYDKDNLYLAAVIVQPHPPYNTYPLKGVGAWNGDDIIIRMSSNPNIPVPIQMSEAESSKCEDLFTADFWWNHNNKQTYWDGYYGIRPAISLTKEEGMQGVEAMCKPNSDGKGYTMEIKVPWKVINPKFIPKPGDKIAFTWEISISVDNPAEPRRAFQIFANNGGTWAFTQPNMWGRAIFK